MIELIFAHTPIFIILRRELSNVILNQMGEGGFEPPTPWSQTKIQAVKINVLYSIIPG